MENEMSFEEYMCKQIEDGYIDSKGFPLKCFKCDGEELFQTNSQYLDSIGGPLLEYDMKCKNCDTIVGSWAYGHWQV